VTKTNLTKVYEYLYDFIHDTGGAGIWGKVLYLALLIFALYELFLWGIIRQSPPLLPAYIDPFACLIFIWSLVFAFYGKTEECRHWSGMTALGTAVFLLASWLYMAGATPAVTWLALAGVIVVAIALQRVSQQIYPSLRPKVPKVAVNCDVYVTKQNEKENGIIDNVAKVDCNVYLSTNKQQEVTVEDVVDALHRFFPNAAIEVKQVENITSICIVCSAFNSLGEKRKHQTVWSALDREFGFDNLPQKMSLVVYGTDEVFSE